MVARAVILSGFSIVVAGCVIGASEAACEVTIAGVCGIGVIVARRAVLTSHDFVGVTDVIAICVTVTRSVAEVTRLGVHTRNEVCHTACNVVTSRRHNTTRNFEFITHTVAVGVVEASFTVTLVELRSVGAAAIINVGVDVVVACRGICAALDATAEVVCR